LERAADPLYRAWIDAEPFGYDAHTWPARSRQSLPDALFQLGSYRRAPQPLALTPSPRKPGTDSFLNDGPLELGEHAHLIERRARPCIIQAGIAAATLPHNAQPDDISYKTIEESNF
jgi:hypothetical protein